MFDFFRKKGNNPEEPAKDGGSQNAAGATASGRTTRDALAEFTATPLPDAIDGLLFRVSMADPTDPTSSSGFDAYAARLLSEAEAPSLRAIAVGAPGGAAPPEHHGPVLVHLRRQHDFSRQPGHHSAHRVRARSFGPHFEGLGRRRRAPPL